MALSRVSPFIKWPGGKSSELDVIHKYSPRNYSRYFDPFLGGGSVLLSISEEVERHGNDLCYELVSLFSLFSNQDEVRLDELITLLETWQSLQVPEALSNSIINNFVRGKIITPQINLALETKFAEINSLIENTELTFSKELRSKLERTLKLQLARKKQLSRQDLTKTINGVLRACFYYAIRDEYNSFRKLKSLNTWRVSYFYLLRELAYASMFRFNSRGEFNVPYGGVSYNDKDILGKVRSFLVSSSSLQMPNCNFYNEDYTVFLNKFNFETTDFVFIDPPYDTEFSTYDNQTFDAKDQVSLGEYLVGCSAKIMILIGDSPLVRSIYKDAKWNIIETDKLYLWNIKSRNDGKTKHLLIRNYLD